MDARKRRDTIGGSMHGTTARPARSMGRRSKVQPPPLNARRYTPMKSGYHMCKVMQVHASGYYAWKAEPQSPRAKDDQRLLGLLKQAWLESCGVFGHRKLTLDMCDLGERCGKHRVARLLKLEGLRS